MASAARKISGLDKTGARKLTNISSAKLFYFELTTQAYNRNVKHEIDAEFKKYFNFVHHEYVF